MIKERRKPRPIAERAKGPDDKFRCLKCDWQLLDGEGVTHTRPCCPDGLQFDLNHGLTLVGGEWRATVDGGVKHES